MHKKIIRRAFYSMLLALPFSPRRSRQGKSSASVSWIEALLPVCAVLVKAFLQELSKLGWIEGKNFTIEYRFTESKA